LAFVADRNFTIPPFFLTFYNLKTKRVEKISTEPIHIKVIGALKKSKLNIKRKTSEVMPEKALHVNNSVTVVNNVWIAVAFIIGLVLGIIIMLFIKPIKFFKNEKTFNLNDEKLLLIKLLPYKDKDNAVKEIVDTLEANLYASKKNENR